MRASSDMSFCALNKSYIVLRVAPNFLDTLLCMDVIFLNIPFYHEYDATTSRSSSLHEYGGPNRCRENENIYITC